MAVAQRIDMEFLGEGNGWTNVTSDVRIDNVMPVRYGIMDSAVTSRVAATGTLVLNLDNSAHNSAHLQGYYSPNHTNCRTGFKLGARLRWVVSTSVGTFYKFVGSLDSIDPDPGRYQQQWTRCVFVDFMDDCARYLLTGIAVQLNKRSSQIFSTIVAAMPRQPSAVEVDTGLDIYPYSLDNTDDTKTKALGEFQKLAMSELGFIYCKGDLSQGGTLTFESRSRRPLVTTASDTFLDTEILGLKAPRARDYAINKVSVSTHPRRVDTTTAVLFNLNTATEVGPNSNITLLCPYRDPTSGHYVRAGGTNMIAPVATTDFLLNSVSDGSGLDLTASCVVTATYGGNSASVLVQNNTPTTGYLWHFQLRGTGIYDDQTSVLQESDDTSINNFGLNAVAIDMPYQNDPRVGTEAAGYLVHLYKDPLTQVQSITLLALKTDDLMYSRCIRREISDRIAIQETVTGLATTSHFFINGISYQTDAKGNLWTTWVLSPADSTAYWILEQVGASELDSTTVLGYGLIIGHTDVAHIDTHLDAAHSDTAHSDVAHGDVAHGDAAHTDTAHVDSAHTDVAHSDVAHADTVHGDSAHSDIPHADSHSDTAHADSHVDTAHTDSAHVDSTSHSDSHDDTAHDDAHDDVAHSDFFGDFTDPGGHFDIHGDSEHADTHGDVSHGDSHSDDGAHSDVAHADTSHADSHSDIAHSDSHSDTSHTDTAHSDSAHADTAHTDVAHTDVAHGDTAHGDVTAHVDTAHVDSAHSDVAFVDVAHVDSHGDVAHGDIN